MANQDSSPGGAEISQSRKASHIETAVQVGVGYVVGIFLQTVIFPLVSDIHIPLSKSWYLAIIVVVVGYGRLFIIRRIFARKT